jgi:uncharacterized protein YjbI with pentapeptide repeats
VVWTDPADEKKSYCVFHAPKEEKRKALGSEERLTSEEFNAFVFSRIHDFVSLANGGGPPETCEFVGTIFPGDISFKRYDKDNPLPKINFNRVIFHGSAIFSNVTFSNGATFGHAEFRKASFDEAKFFGKATFSSAIFDGVAEFDEAEFHGGAQFNRTEFHYDAEFSLAVFKCVPSFRGTIFSRVGSFVNVTYKKNAAYIKTIFENKADFRGATSTLGGRVHLIELEPNSLEHITFSLSDLPLFTLNGCRWPSRLGLDIHESHIPGVLQQCEQLYRAMKKCADDEHDRRMVSDWHYAEKLAGLKILLKVRGWLAALDTVFSSDYSWTVKANSSVAFLFHTPLVLFRSTISITFWYWLFSGFGEKVFRAGMWLLALVLFVLALMGTVSMTDTNSTVACVMLPERLYAGLQHLLFIASPQYTPAEPLWRSALLVLTRVLIPLQFTLFALAVRNRFRR